LDKWFKLTTYDPFAIFALVVLNAATLAYIIQSIADLARLLLVHRKARGFLFVIGAAMFVGAKALAAYAIWFLPGVE